MTESKQGGVHRNNSENIYKAIFENSIDAILITSTDGGIQSANPAACKMFGYSVEEFVKAGRDGILDPSDERIPLLLLEREKTGKISGELRYRRKDGTIFPVDFTSSVFKDSEGRDRTITILRDATDLKTTLEKLKLSVDEYRSLFENSMMGISQAKPGSGFFRINQAYADLYGYPDIQSLLKDVSTNIKMLYSDPADREKVLSLLEKNGYMPPTEFELNKKNGEKFWALVSAKQVKDASGKLLYLQAEHFDITSHKIAEAELRKSKDSLEKLNQHMNEVLENERSQIALNLHDDLGQKLTALNMDLAWLKARIGVQSRTVENKLRQMTLLMNEAIDSIQKISYGLRPSILDDLGLIPALEWQIKEFIRTSGILCKTSFVPKEIEIDSQSALIIFRVVQEALTNVVRHSKATKVHVILTIRGEILEVTVEDNGKGIEAEKIENPKSFGLAGMRERILLVGGEFIISGKPGEGTIIQVRIPLCLKAKTDPNY
ncbi:MAG: PAS domain S-box protein [Bacteroidales bacterium]|nr:PAS domain S-box protein [Bacteroidales bacterium]MBK7628144.1 PAS domain S-box protein [Bacteroidales bacterium]